MSSKRMKVILIRVDAGNEIAFRRWAIAIPGLFSEENKIRRFGRWMTEEAGKGSDSSDCEGLSKTSSRSSSSNEGMFDKTSAMTAEGKLRRPDNLSRFKFMVDRRIHWSSDEKYPSMMNDFSDGRGDGSRLGRVKLELSLMCKLCIRELSFSIARRDEENVRFGTVLTAWAPMRTVTTRRDCLERASMVLTHFVRSAMIRVQRSGVWSAIVLQYRHV